MWQQFILSLILAYVSGAVPWSVWLGKLLYGVDPREYGDGNPGTANAFKAAGKRLGAAVILLDFLKAFLPVLVAKWGLNFAPDQLFWIALAPTVGHAFSIFLRFRGGRALMTLFGVWCGLTLYEVPVVMGIVAVVFTITLKKDIYSSLAIVVGVIVYLILRGADSWMVMLAVAQLFVLVVKINPLQYLSTDSLVHRYGALR